MTFKNKFLLTATLAMSSLASAVQAAEKAPLLAKIEQGAGLMMPPENKNDPVFVGRVFEVTEDGSVYVLSRYLKNGKTIIKESKPLTYKQEDIVEFKRSINQLKLERPLVVDENAPVLCDGGFAHFSVVINGKLTLIQENNDCSPNRVRAGRSWLEVAVLDVLTDLLKAYYNIPQK
jgi:hypothetical protein